jgi:hypothetical protein
MKQTSLENIEQKSNQRANEQMKCNFSSEEFGREYVPPHFASDKTVIIP